MERPPFEKAIEMESYETLRADVQLALDRLVFYKSTCLLADALIAAGTGAGNVATLIQARMMLPGGAKFPPAPPGPAPGVFGVHLDRTGVEVMRDRAVTNDVRKDAEARAPESRYCTAPGPWGRCNVKHRASDSYCRQHQAELDAGTAAWAVFPTDPVERPKSPILAKPGHFFCKICREETPDRDNAPDDMAGACSKCWAKAHPEAMADPPPPVVPTPADEAKVEAKAAENKRNSVMTTGWRESIDQERKRARAKTKSRKKK